MGVVMGCQRLLVAPCVVCVFAAGSLAARAQDGTDPCFIQPWDSVDNGVGAEPGVVREFGSGLTVPPQCLSGGKVFVPFVEVVLTRTAAGSPDLVLNVFAREPDPGSGLPGSFMTPAHTVEATGIPIFPSHQILEFPVLADGETNTNNVLWGDYVYLDAAYSGANAGVFIAADQSGAPGETPCFTGINGAVPDDPCTSGNPNLNALGIGASTYTFYGRYAGGGQVMGRQPLSSTFAGRYAAPFAGGGGRITDLRLREGPGGPVVCEFFNVPDDFSFTCPVTPGQSDLLNGSGIFVELDGNGPTGETRLLSAGSMIFVDGFESGDTSAWSGTQR